MESIRNIEDEETKFLKLQKQYRTGKIKAEELSEQQIKSLGKLYDRQIEKLTNQMSIFVDGFNLTRYFNNSIIKVAIKELKLKMEV